MRAGCTLACLLVQLCFPSRGIAQFPSWIKHVVASSALTAGTGMVLRDPWIGASFAVGLNIGHEIGQARVRRRWTGDNTRDLVGGVLGGLATALLVDRLATRPAEVGMPSLEPVRSTLAERESDEEPAQCSRMDSQLDRSCGARDSPSLVHHSGFSKARADLPFDFVISDHQPLRVYEERLEAARDEQCRLVTDRPNYPIYDVRQCVDRLRAAPSKTANLNP